MIKLVSIVERKDPRFPWAYEDIYYDGRMLTYGELYINGMFIMTDNLGKLGWHLFAILSDDDEVTEFYLHGRIDRFTGARWKIEWWGPEPDLRDGGDDDQAS